jgi:putative copper export protein
LFALCFFGTLAFFALCIFRKSDQKNPMDRTLEKRQRDIVYLVCGIAILACIVLLLLIALIQLLSGKPWLQPLRPVLILESLAIFAFGIAWFVKGETLGILKDKRGGS